MCRYFPILKVSLIQASVSGVIALAGGLTISYFLAHRKMPKTMRDFIHAVSKVSFVFPGVSMALGFLLIFGKNGVLNAFLRVFGMQIDVLYTFAAVVMGHAFYNIPVVVYITGTLWERLSGELIEAAQVDGASPLKVLSSVEIPILLPSIVSSYLMAFLYSFTSFAVVMTIGGFRYRTLEVEIYSQISRLNFSGATTLTLLQIAVVSSAALMTSTLKPRDFPYGYPKRWKRGSLSTSLTIISLSLIVFPMVASLMYGVFSHNAFNLLSERGWSFLGESFRRILLWSFSIAISAGLITTSVSTIAGRSGKVGKRSAGVFATIPSAFSSATLAFAYLAILLKVSLEGFSLAALIILHSVISLPMAYRIMESGWRAIPSEVGEAASVDGAKRLSIFMFIDFPLLLPSILRAFTLSVAMSLSELAGVLILSGGRFMTFSSAVYRLMSSRHFPEATALNSILVLIILLIFFLGEALSWEK